MKIKNHYDDCPYNCNVNGMVLDDSLGRLVPCPHCSEIRKQLMRDGQVEVEGDVRVPLSTVVGVKSEYLSSRFIYEAVIPDGELLFIDEESVEKQREMAEELYLGLSAGNLPEVSMCFGISIKGRAEVFAYPMIAKAYMGGLGVCRFMSASEFSRMALNVNEDMSEFYGADFMMMLINEGSTMADIASAKGIMQSRALKGKPTVFVTTWTVEACSALLGYYNNDSYSLATPVFVEYKTSKKKGHTNYINKLLGVENGAVVENSVVPDGAGSGSIGVSMSDLLKI